MDTSFFQVIPSEIEQLNKDQLISLLSSLISQEAKKNNIPGHCFHCPLNIETNDGGIDAKISWNAGAEYTDYFPKRLVGFQCKAQDMGPADCKNEMLRTEDKLKEGIENILDNGGMYIIFCRQKVTDSMLSARIKKMEEAVRQSGKTYDPSSLLRFYDAKKIADWTNQYLSSVLLVKKYNGKPNPISALTWEEWKGYSEYCNPYYDDDRADYIKQIRNCLCDGKEKIIRIEGLVGLGKSRLALECFNDSLLYDGEDKNTIKSLQAQVVYIDSNKCEDNIYDLIRMARRENLCSILIVDNCSLEMHYALSQEIKHENSSLSLITICDYLTPGPEHWFLKIVLRPQKESGVVKKIVENEYSKVLGQNDIDRIIEFAQGFPLLAQRLCEARLHL